MYKKEEIYTCETSEGYEIKVICKPRFGTRSDLRDLYYQLKDICDAESTKLYRLAWRMVAHGCNEENIRKCREEALLLLNTGYPERILDETIRWDYAFKF